MMGCMVASGAPGSSTRPVGNTQAARMGEERLAQSVLFGELLGGKGYSGEQDNYWMVHLKEDMSVFGMKLKGGEICTEGR